MQTSTVQRDDRTTIHRVFVSFSVLELMNPVKYSPSKRRPIDLLNLAHLSIDIYAFIYAYIFVLYLFHLVSKCRIVRPFCKTSLLVPWLSAKELHIHCSARIIVRLPLNRVYTNIHYQFTHYTLFYIRQNLIAGFSSHSDLKLNRT